MFSQNYTTVTGNIVVPPSQAIPQSTVKDLESLKGRSLKKLFKFL